MASQPQTQFLGRGAAVLQAREEQKRLDAVNAKIDGILPKMANMAQNGAPDEVLARYVQLQGIDPKDFNRRAGEKELDRLGGPLSGFIESFGQGLLLGFSDEIAAGVHGALEAPFTDETFDQIYDRDVNLSRRRLAAHRAANPTAATVTEIGGAVMPAIATAGASLPAAGASTGRVIASGATAGAATGAVYGFGSGEGGFENRINQAGEGAAIGGVLGGVIPGGAQLARSLRPKAQEIMARVVQGMTSAEVTAARQLFTDAAARGTPLTWSEAINSVTNGRFKQLASIQRVVEEAPAPNAVNTMTANRAAGNAAAMDRQLAEIGPQPTGLARSEVPNRLQQAAAGNMREIENARSAAVRPLYARGRQTTPAQLFGNDLDRWMQFFERPALRQAWQAAQTNLANRGVPVHQWIRFGQDGRAAQILDVPTAGDIIEIDKALGAMIENARDPVTGKIKDAAGLSFQAARHDLEGLTDLIPGLRQGKEAYGRISREVVDPIRRSPLGQVAEGDASLGSQRQALMPRGEQGTLDPAQIRMSVTMMNRRDPAAVNDWVNVNLRSIFDEQTENLMGGANEWGGAKFAKALIGNRQQRENVRALVESLPNGERKANGLFRLLEIMQAQGFRRAPGSPTAQNTQIVSELKQPTAGIDFSSLTPFGAKSALREGIENWRFGRNTATLADMLTNPRTADLFERLAGLNPRSEQAMAIAAAILAQQPTRDLTGNQRQR